MSLIYSPSLSFTIAPTLSQSGSVPIIKCASFFLASSMASLKAFLSSGLGYSTVENSESGISCSGTTKILLNPISFNTLFTGTLPVPCRGVSTTLKSSVTSFIVSPLNDCFLTSLIYASSTCSPRYVKSPLSFASSLSNILTFSKSSIDAIEFVIAFALSVAI